MHYAHMQEAQQKLANIRTFAQANGELTFDELYPLVEPKVKELIEFCNKNKVPFVVSTFAIVNEFCKEDEPEDDSTYEDEDEEEEEVEEPQQESSYYEDPADSSY